MEVVREYNITVGTRQGREDGDGAGGRDGLRRKVRPSRPQVADSATMTEAAAVELKFLGNSPAALPVSSSLLMSAAGRQGADGAPVKVGSGGPSGLGGGRQGSSPRLLKSSSLSGPPPAPQPALSLPGSPTAGSEKREEGGPWKRRREMQSQKRLLSDLSAVLAAVASILAIANNEVLHSGGPSLAVSLIKAGITAASAIHVVVTVLFYLSCFAMDKFLHLAPADAPFRSSRHMKWCLLESLVCALHVPPGVTFVVSMKRIATTPQVSETSDFTGDALNCFVFLRLLLLFRVVRYRSQWYSAGATFIGALNRVHFNLFFVIKAMTHLSPFRLLFGVLIPTALGLAYSIWVFERESHSRHINFGDTVWLLLITMTTVGYGDLTPENHFGRALCVVAAITGLLGTAFLVAFVSSKLRLSKAEEKVVGLMGKDEARRRMRTEATRVISATWRFYKTMSSIGEEVPPLLRSKVRGGLLNKLSVIVQEFRSSKQDLATLISQQSRNAVLEDLYIAIMQLGSEVDTLSSNVSALVAAPTKQADALDELVQAHARWLEEVQEGSFAGPSFAPTSSGLSLGMPSATSLGAALGAQSSASIAGLPAGVTTAAASSSSIADKREPRRLAPSIHHSGGGSSGKDLNLAVAQALSKGEDPASAVLAASGGRARPSSSRDLTALPSHPSTADSNQLISPRRSMADLSRDASSRSLRSEESEVASIIETRLVALENTVLSRLEGFGSKISQRIDETLAKSQRRSITSVIQPYDLVPRSKFL